MKKSLFKILMVFNFCMMGTFCTYAQTYEAENATLTGVTASSSQAGFSGTTYVGTFGTLGNSVEFSITGATAGSQDIAFRYANGSSTAYLHLYVNGIKIRQVTLPNTGGWNGNKCYDKIDNVTLIDGNNTIKYQRDADDIGGNINADCLKFSGISTVTGINISSTTLTVKDNNNSQLTATVVPAIATNKTVTWTSSNTAIATVNTFGFVTGKAAGNTTITVTTADGNKTATCSLTVISSGLIKCEAENALLYGVTVSTNHTGYSGTGFVDNVTDLGDYVQFSITGASAGSQNISLGYSNAVGTARALNLYVNGLKVATASFSSTVNLDSWLEKVDNVTLNAGNNTIKYQYDSGNTGPINIDYLLVAGSGTVTEISKNVKESDILLTPNPLSKGSLSIKLPEGATQLSIFDLTGKIVYQKQVTKNEYLIDSSVFKSEGVYIVNVLTTKNSINKKVIITK